jgi:hypothetical protein
MPAIRSRGIRIAMRFATKTIAAPDMPGNMYQNRQSSIADS